MIQSKSPTLIMLPGWQDSGPDHWQSLWLKKYPNAVKVEQRDWMKPEKSEWVKTLNETIAKHEGEEIILIGHSLACATIAHWANEHAARSKTKILGALLVAPADMDTPDFPRETIKNFGPMPLHKLPFKTIVTASENDPWVNIERAEYFAKSWGAQFVNIGPHGHINTDAGFGDWPEGEKLLKSLIS